MFTEAALGLLGGYFVYKLFVQKDQLSQVPGPQPWPIVGNSFQVDVTRPPFQLHKWAKQYGPVFKISIGNRVCIIVSGSDEIHEVLVGKKDDFSNRFAKGEVYRADLWSMGNHDLFTRDCNEEFKKMRALMMKGLKLHNLKLIEDLSLAVARDLMQDFLDTNGEAFDPCDYIYSRLLQFLYVMVFTNKVEMSSPDFQKLKKLDMLTNKNLGMVGSAPWLDQFPWLRFFGNQTYKEILECNKLSRELFATWKEEVKNKEVDDCWFSEVLKTLENNPDMKEESAMMLAINLFFAGSITTTTILALFLNVMVHNPHVQKNIQKEVDEVLGDSKQVTFRDREDMPYTYACILESTRYISLVPLFQHTTMCDTSVAGYQIPAGTQVFVNSWAHHHNENFFPQPQEFKPERFLNSEGKLVLAGKPPRKHVVAFGAGSRSCPGEVLAMTRLFIMFASIARHFNVEPATTIEEQPSVLTKDLTLGVVLSPKPYKLRCVPRN